MTSEKSLDPFNTSITADMVEVFLQPIFDYKNNSLVGAECLSRIKKEDGDYYYPEEFLEVLENNGQIAILDLKVLDIACTYVSKWLEKSNSIKNFTLSVNISKSDLSDPNFTTNFIDVFNKHKLNKEMINVVIKENSFFTDSTEIGAKIEELHRLGFGVELDDFGSDGTSINVLSSVPIDILRFNSSLLSGFYENSKHKRMLFSFVKLSKWLDMVTIGEGVESKEQADYLMNVGCSLMQGNFFDKAMPIDEFEKKYIGTSPIVTYRKHVMHSYRDVSIFFEGEDEIAALFNYFTGGAAIAKMDKNNLELLRTNNKFIDYCGVTKSDIDAFSTHFLDLLSTSQKEIIKSVFDETIKNKSEVTREIPGAEGTNKYYLLNAFLIDKDNERGLFFVTMEDISERRRLEFEKEKLSYQLTSMENNLPGAVLTAVFENDKGVIINYSDYLCKLTGYSREEIDEIIRYNSRSIFYEDDGLLLDTIFNKVGDVESIRRRIISKEDEYVWVSVYGSSVLVGEKIYAHVFIFEITDRIEKEHILETTTAELKMVLNNIPSGILIFNTIENKTILSRYNRSAWLTLGFFSEQQFKKEFPSEFTAIKKDINPNQVYSMEEAVSSIIYNGEKYRDSVIIRLNNGDVVNLRILAGPINMHDQNITQITFYDITEAMNKETFHYANSLLSVFDAIYVIDLKDNTYIPLSSSENKDSVDKHIKEQARVLSNAYKTVEKRYQERIKDFLSLENIQKIISSNEKSPSIEYRAEDEEDGIIKWYRSFFVKTSSPTKVLFCKENIEDIKKIDTLRIENEELRVQAMIDPLTGLFTRREAEKLIKNRLQIKFSDEVDAFIIIDINSFKKINDTIGHLEGDKALRILARELNGLFRHDDIIYRFGGDEFVVYLKDIKNIEIALRKVTTFQAQFSKYSLNNSGVLTCSIGIKMIMDERDFDTIFKKADDALYDAKEVGGNAIKISKEIENE